MEKKKKKPNEKSEVNVNWGIIRKSKKKMTKTPMNMRMIQLFK